jgi:hypothetical protein
MRAYSRERQKLIETLPDPPPREGAEGWVYETTEAGILAKIFKKPEEDHRREKIEALLLSPPRDPPKQPGDHRRFAWPQELLLDAKTGAFLGATIPLIPNSGPLHEFIDPAGREYRERAFRVRLAIAVAELFADIHRNHLAIVVGDVSPRNILSDGLGRAALIDLDSVQLTIIQGNTYFCPVGSRDYLPAELLRPGTNLREVRRTREHDLFGLAVIIFQLLFDGRHAFAAVGNAQTLTERILAGTWPHLNGSSERPPPGAPLLGAFPKEIQTSLTQTFVEGHWDPKARLAADDWVDVLTRNEKALGRLSTSVAGPAAPRITGAASAPPKRRTVVVAVGGGAAAAALAAAVGFVGGGGGGMGRPIGDGDVKGRLCAMSVMDKLAPTASVEPRPRPRPRQKAVTNNGGSLPRGPEHSSETPLYWKLVRDGGYESLSFGAALQRSLEGQR